VILIVRFSAIVPFFLRLARLILAFFPSLTWNDWITFYILFSMRFQAA
jgi:hypothetical protein